MQLVLVSQTLDVQYFENTDVCVCVHGHWFFACETLGVVAHLHIALPTRMQCVMTMHVSTGSICLLKIQPRIKVPVAASEPTLAAVEPQGL